MTISTSQKRRSSRSKSLKWWLLYSLLLLLFVHQLAWKPKPVVTYPDVDAIDNIHWEWHPKLRQDRFPSVNERVRLYMSIWYPPYCPDVSLPFNKTHARGNYTHYFDSYVWYDRTFVMERTSIQNCSSHITHRMHFYCKDSLELLERIDPTTPIVVRYGDKVFQDAFQVPMLAKFRLSAATPQDLQAVTSLPCRNRTLALPTRVDQPQEYPIVWNFNIIRHWGALGRAQQADIPWSEKKLGAIWRGALTGNWNDTVTFGERCAHNLRCQFVQNHVNSSLVDAAFALTLNRLPPSLEQQWKRNESSLAEMQSHKIIISLEGNDVASGLKWGLWSQSVILMPPPTRTSWAMEELLEPWVHYIPLDENGANAEEQVEWVRTHDEQAQRIAERATLFIYDLIYHPQAEADNEQIKTEIIRRYQQLWV